MNSPEIEHLLALAEESHLGAKTLLERGLARFSAAQSYYTMFYLAEALLFFGGKSFGCISFELKARSQSGKVSFRKPLSGKKPWLPTHKKLYKTFTRNSSI